MVKLVTLSHPQSIEEVQNPGLVPVNYIRLLLDLHNIKKLRITIQDPSVIRTKLNNDTDDFLFAVYFKCYTILCMSAINQSIKKCVCQQLLRKGLKKKKIMEFSISTEGL